MSENLALEKIAPLIHEVRGERVILIHNHGRERAMDS